MQRLPALQTVKSLRWSRFRTRFFLELCASSVCRMSTFCVHTVSDGKCFVFPGAWELLKATGLLAWCSSLSGIGVTTVWSGCFLEEP